MESPENDNKSSSSLKPSSNLDLLVNQFNNATPENSNDPEETYFSKNCDIGERHNIKIPHKDKSLWLFYIMHVPLIKTLMTFNISWVALKQNLRL